MKTATFMRLLKIARSYDPFTEYIGGYWRQVEIEKKNRKLMQDFNDAMQEDWHGYNRGIPASVQVSDIEKNWLLWIWNADMCIEDLDEESEFGRRVQVLVEELDAELMAESGA